MHRFQRHPLEAPRPSWLRQIFSGEWLSQGMGGWAPAFGILLVAGVGWMQIQDGAVFVEQERAQDSGQAVSSVAIPRPETREEKARPRTAVREVSPPTTANSASRFRGWTDSLWEVRRTKFVIRREGKRPLR